VPENRKHDFEDLMLGKAYAMIGKVKKKPALSFFGLNDKRLIEISLEKLRETWSTLGGD
jgi:hypothetical protein